MRTVIYWLRRDLRLADNLALHAACAGDAAVIAVFVLDEGLLRSPRAGRARLAFLYRALQSLDNALRQYGTRLLIRSGNPVELIPRLVAETGAEALYFNRDYSPYARQRDAAVEVRLTIPVYAFDDGLLLPPGTVLTGAGKPYTVFTPFRKNWNLQAKPAVSTFTLKSETFHPVTGIESESLPVPDPIELPEASESAAQVFLAKFLADDLLSYSQTRNFLPINPFQSPRPPGSSYLSPYLRLGLLSPRQAYQGAQAVLEQTQSKIERASIEAWIGELAWREFYMHILYHFPQVLAQDFREKYRSVEWSDNPDHLAAWQAGQTGYPIIDAPMRQLNAIGWMPNRARMIVASFLTKDLLIHWKHGELYFMQQLIDGDPAANNGGWQWAAGTGTDAQPYFRIFNPVTQSQKFATPEYLRHWLPELRAVPDEAIHAPWKLKQLPAEYPRPIVDHAEARSQTVAAFKGAAGKND